LPHASKSSLIRSANSSGVFTTGSKPSAAKRSLMSVSVTKLAISRLSKSHYLLRRAGRHKDSHPRVTLYFWISGFRDGWKAGKLWARVLLMTASARKLPAWIWGAVGAKAAMRRLGADCFVVAMKRGNARGAKGVGHRHWDRVNRQREEPDNQWKAAAFVR